MSGSVGSLVVVQARDPVMFCISVFFLLLVGRAPHQFTSLSRKGCMCAPWGPEFEGLSAHLLT